MRFAHDETGLPELVEYLADERFVQVAAGRLEPVGRGRQRGPVLWWWVMHHPASRTDVAVLIDAGGQLAASALIAQGRAAGTASAPETAGVAASFAATESPFWTQLDGVRTDERRQVRALIDELRRPAREAHEVIGRWLNLTAAPEAVGGPAGRG